MIDDIKPRKREGKWICDPVNCLLCYKAPGPTLRCRGNSGAYAEGVCWPYYFARVAEQEREIERLIKKGMDTNSRCANLETQLTRTFYERDRYKAERDEALHDNRKMHDAVERAMSSRKRQKARADAAEAKIDAVIKEAAVAISELECLVDEWCAKRDRETDDGEGGGR